MDVAAASIVGASGYIGGELLRLLVGHPMVRVSAAISRSAAGDLISTRHPNLRAVTDLRFSGLDNLPDSDVVFLAGKFGEYQELVPIIIGSGAVLIDLRPDFRVADVDMHESYYGPRSAAIQATMFQRGLPELYRKRLSTANCISVPGCTATAGILAIAPLATNHLITPDVTISALTGSSGAGSTVGPWNTHSERRGAMRVFAPAGHRHEIEITDATGVQARMVATGVEAVRGVQVVCRAVSEKQLTEAELWEAYRSQYHHEPFVRLLSQHKGGFRYPDPKILQGSNYCDVGFALDGSRHHVTLIAALDNLMKGGAGNAVQCMNLRMGWKETLALEFLGLHPI